jgi:DNA-binding winged helix-turn-helix (wHTH) protein
MPDTLPDRVRFGGFELDLRAGELRKDGHLARLQEKPLRVLRLLVERGGELVTREELQRKLWPNDTIVDFEHGINTAIKKLRQALADSPEVPTYIETIPRRGYRLLVPVECLWPKFLPLNPLSRSALTRTRRRVFSPNQRC